MQRKRIRRAISVYYLAMGMVFASWASRIPDVKAALSLDDGSLGALLFAIPAGQIAMMAISAMVIAHWGSRMVLRVSLVAYAAVLFAISQAPTFVSLFVVLFLFGMAANILNISVNTQSVELERLYGALDIIDFSRTMEPRRAVGRPRGYRLRTHRAAVMGALCRGVDTMRGRHPTHGVTPYGRLEAATFGREGRG